MKKWSVLLALMLAVVATGCTFDVESGNVGIIVDNLGDNQGGITVVGPGRHGYNAITQVTYEYQTYVVRYPFTQASTEGSEGDEAIYFQNMDGMSMNIDVAVSAKVDSDPQKVKSLFSTYRRNMNDLMKTQVRDALRDAFQQVSSGMSIDALYGAGKSKLIAEVQRLVREKFEPAGIIIESVSPISDIRFPQAVTEAIEAKVKATQVALQRENEVQKAQAEAEIKIASARGEAEANKIRAGSLSPQAIEWQRLMNEAEKIKIARDYVLVLQNKWNGAYPSVVSGDSGIMLNMSDLVAKP